MVSTAGSARPRLLAAAAVVGWLALGPGSGAPAAATYDWCYNSCGSEASCALECENDGGGTTTCGAYDGGASNGWCDGETCDDICGPWSGASWECYHEGQPTDCGTYGEYAECGDGLCANLTNGENCATCPQDCDGACPSIECGNFSCEDHETWRNCPADCEEPAEGYCGDGICDSSEDENCEDCIVPDEFCEGFHYVCPVGFLCIGNQCVSENFYAFTVYCGPGGQCPEGYRCREATNVWTQQKELICVRWWDAN